MSSVRLGLAAFVTAFIALFLTLNMCLAVDRPEELEGAVGIFSKLGTKVNTDLKLNDSNGRELTIGQLISDGKPLIVVPVYYRCPRLCGLLLDGVFELIDRLPLVTERDYRVLAISFNPEEGIEDAATLAVKYKLNERKGIIFSVGNPLEVAQVMKQLGFIYKPDGKDFAHSSGFMVLTPKGEISQLFTGIQFSAWDVRLALVEASSGSIGTPVDHLLLYCFRFDPLQGRYTWAVTGLLKIGGVLTLLILGFVYYKFVFKNVRKKSV